MTFTEKYKKNVTHTSEELYWCVKFPIWTGNLEPSLSILRRGKAAVIELPEKETQS